MTQSGGPAAAAFRVHVLEETLSTNAEAMQRGLDGDPGPLWIMARRQTAGRGRSGRTWISPPGNLYASVVQRLTCDHARLPQLSLVAGIVALEAIRSRCADVDGQQLRLKWPNDLLLGGAKLGGILIESSAVGPGQEVLAVIGFGINLASHPDDLEPSPTHLATAGCVVSPVDMLTALAEQLEQWLGVWRSGDGFAMVRKAWLERTGKVGEPIAVHVHGQLVTGRFAGIDADGALLIADGNNRVLTFTFGDVAVLPENVEK